MGSVKSTHRIARLKQMLRKELRKVNQRWGAWGLPWKVEVM